MLLSHQFASYFVAAKAEEAVEKVRVEAEKILEIPDEDDAEELYNCQFTLLAYAAVLYQDSSSQHQYEVEAW